MNESAKIFAKNLRMLMRFHDVNQHALSRMSGVSQKTISNMLNPGDERSPNLEKIALIAKAFKVEPWHLLIPNLPPDVIYNSSIERIVNNFAASDARAREIQLKVSETTAEYSRRLKFEKPNDLLDTI